MSSDTPSTSPADGKSKGKSFGTKILVGAACVAGLHALRSSWEESRYPLRIEYELAKACIDGGSARLSRELYLAKQEQCLCTIEAATKKISYDEFKESTDKFVSTFRKLSSTCGNKGRS